MRVLAVFLFVLPCIMGGDVDGGCLLEDRDFLGGDYKTFAAGNDFNKCRDQCLAESACVAFTYYDSNCYLKTDAHNAISTKAGCISARKSCYEDTTGSYKEWCKFEDSFLYDYSSGIFTYDTLSKAQEQCAVRSDCAGITQEPYNNDRYTLRKGPALENGKSPSGETSWVACNSGCLLENKDFYAGDYRVFEVGSDIIQCRAACYTDDACVAFTYYGSKCHLKTDAHNAISDKAGCVSARKSCYSTAITTSTPTTTSTETTTWTTNPYCS